MALLDTSEEITIAESEIGMPCGELLTPLTRRQWEGRRFGIDNGAFSKFDAAGFLSLLNRQRPHQAHCIFVAVPDVVCSARRTLEVFTHWQPRLAKDGWPLALVAQDGQEDLRIPWTRIAAIFIGGSTQWKTSQHAEAICKAAKAMGKWVHVGRVNTPERLDRVKQMGADSIDGSGIGRYSWMRRRMNARDLFASNAGGESSGRVDSEALPEGSGMRSADSSTKNDGQMPETAGVRG